MSGFRAGCVENFIRGPNAGWPTPGAFRRMSGPNADWPGPAPFRRMPGPNANWSGPAPFRRMPGPNADWPGPAPFRRMPGPGPGQGPGAVPGPAPFRRTPETMGWAGGDMGPRGRMREGNWRAPGIPQQCNFEGRGGAALARRPSEGAPGLTAPACWDSTWQGEGGWWENPAAGTGRLPETPGGATQRQPERSAAAGLVPLGERFAVSEQDLERLFGLVRREAQRRGAPWVAGLSRAVEEISQAADSAATGSWQAASPLHGECQYEERPAADATAGPAPEQAASEGVVEQIRRVWIAGHSSVTWASRRACSSPYGQHLGLAANGVEVLWMDKQGLHSDELIPALLRQAEVQPWPDALVIHLGSNDFEQIPGIRLIKCMKKDFIFINSVYPNTKIIWSDIIPNRRRRHEKCLDRSRRKVNKQISDFVRSLGGIQIRHEFFSAECASLYNDDGIQLSDIGNDLFNMMIQGAIKSAFGIV
ncbi:uncharacterized protein LOC115094935 [Rhinatrema bivittatum]|uniref:uncharacterized protein LOC115094935 n=1 Tax=Rhinatrema bivittatum TaxID=194408 RepID=UPI0011289F6A|nr:uncharacterized protein LOC115094935 [Rhinatrema bivittatum]